MQGLSAGAEYAGAVVTVVEHADETKRGLYGSAPQVGAILGLLLGNVTFLTMTNLNQTALLEWGWRVPFLISAVLLVIGVVIRGKMAESPVFEQAKAEGATTRRPLLDALRDHPKPLLIVLVAQSGPASMFYVSALFMVSYAVKTLGFSQADMLIAVCIGAAVEVCAMPAFGALSDRLGQRNVFIAGLLLLAAGIAPFTVAVLAKSYFWMVFGYVVILGLGHAATFASQAALFAGMFPPPVRYTGLSLAYQGSGTIFGATLPIIATLLVSSRGGSLWYLVAYLLALSVLSLIAILASAPEPAPAARQDPALAGPRSGSGASA